MATKKKASKKTASAKPLKKTQAKSRSVAAKPLKKTGKAKSPSKSVTKKASGTKVKKNLVRPSSTVKKTTAKKPVALRKPLKKTRGPVDRLQDLKKNLLAKRQAIVREAKDEIAKYVNGEHRQLVDTALDEGDWAVVDISEDINFARLGAHRRALMEIDESLRKIGEGSYGICEDCGDEISSMRLKVLPTATLCISCQEKKEQMETIEKEEIS